jgi:hypothetical protein
MNNLSTSWPSATADPLKFNAKQFVSDMANAAGNDSWDGWVRNNPIDIPTYPFDPDNFKGSGDPRYPLNVATKAMFDTFLPRQLAYQEVVDAGGCQIINNYICDSDGNPIVKASVNCKPGVNIEVIKPKEVEEFTKTSFNNALIAEADAFVNFLNVNYLNNGWTAILYDMLFVNQFVIKLKKANSSNVYFKYFYDQKNYISSSLQIPLTESDVNDNNIIDTTDEPKDFLALLKSTPMIFNQSS